MSCLAVLAVTAALAGSDPYLYDGDTVTVPGSRPSARLTSGSGPFDTPEINGHASCREEHALGMAARDRARQLMPGRLCVIGTDGAGSYGRDLAVLYGRDGQDVGMVLIEEGLAARGRTFDWCEVLQRPR